MKSMNRSRTSSVAVETSAVTNEGKNQNSNMCLQFTLFLPKILAGQILKCRRPLLVNDRIAEWAACLGAYRVMVPNKYLVIALGVLSIELLFSYKLGIFCLAFINI